MPIFCLSLHANYACQRSGACCTSAWPIPLSAEERDRLTAAVENGTLLVDPTTGSLFVDEPGTPPASAGTLALRNGCDCVFYDGAGRGCAIHRDLGHAALPSSCQHFPRTVLIDPRGTFVSLSHYCPTVAALAFEEGPQPAIIEAPESFTRGIRLEGLDASSTLPPLLHPGMLADHAGYAAWERVAIAVMGVDCTPEEGLRHLVQLTERVRRWRPGQMSLAAHVELVALESRGVLRGSSIADYDATLALADVVRESVPAGVARPQAATPTHREAYELLVAPTWGEFAAPIRRYLAARSFANWVAYQGRGFRTVLHSVSAALSLVRVEAARIAAGAAAPLDEAILAEAMRTADLWLLHLAAPDVLASRLSSVEGGGLDEMTGVL